MTQERTEAEKCQQAKVEDSHSTADQPLELGNLKIPNFQWNLKRKKLLYRNKTFNITFPEEQAFCREKKDFFAFGEEGEKGGGRGGDGS